MANISGNTELKDVSMLRTDTLTIPKTVKSPVSLNAGIQITVSADVTQPKPLVR